MRLRFFLLVFLCPLMAFSQLENTQVTITDGITDSNLKNKMESGISSLLKSFNTAVISGENPDIDDVRINNYTETELQTYYGGFASQRFLGALYVSMIGGDNAITVNSAEYADEADNGVVTVSLSFDGYNYLGTNNLFSGENVTIKFIGDKKTDTGFTATSIVVNGSGIVSDNAKQYREISVTFTDVEAGVGTESTEGRGIPFVFLGEKPCICDFASGVSTSPNYVQYEKVKHEFQIEFPIEGLVAEF